SNSGSINSGLGPLLIDVRSAAEQAQSMIPGAITQAEFEAMLNSTSNMNTNSMDAGADADAGGDADGAGADAADDADCADAGGRAKDSVDTRDANYTKHSSVTTPTPTPKPTTTPTTTPDIRHRLLVPYCTIGVRSGRYGTRLVKSGFRNVRNGEGILLWTQGTDRMDNINSYGTQQEEEENVPEAQELAPASLATPVLAPAPVLSYVASVAIPQQRLSRAQLQLLLDKTRWAPDHEQIYFVDLDGEFSLADLMNI
ncbi:hypothetical protein B484DRAFT_439429, partial [Ochromonadaceae sp. CCMP2298]